AHLRPERLVHRQESLVVAPGEAFQEAEAPVAALRGGGGEGHGSRPGLRRVAEADVGAALELEREVEPRGSRAGYRVGDRDVEPLAVDLLLAEPGVLVGQAGRQLQRAER